VENDRTARAGVNSDNENTSSLSSCRFANSPITPTPVLDQFQQACLETCLQPFCLGGDNFPSIANVSPIGGNYLSNFGRRT